MQMEWYKFYNILSLSTYKISLQFKTNNCIILSDGKYEEVVWIEKFSLKCILKHFQINEKKKENICFLSFWRWHETPVISFDKCYINKLGRLLASGAYNLT